MIQSIIPTIAHTMVDIMKYSHSRIHSVIVITNKTSPILTAIIYKNQFQIPMSLRQDGVNTSSNSLFPIENGDNYTHKFIHTLYPSSVARLPPYSILIFPSTTFRRYCPYGLLPYSFALSAKAALSIQPFT